MERPASRVGTGHGLLPATPAPAQALAFAARLARDCDAVIAARSVVASPVTTVDLSTYDADWLKRSESVAQEQLARALAAVDVEAADDVAVGLTVDELVELSKDVDVLVLGSRGWGQPRRTMTGSTAAGVMRKAHAPVIVLPGGAATGPGPPPDARRPQVESPASWSIRSTLHRSR